MRSDQEDNPKPWNSPCVHQSESAKAQIARRPVTVPQPGMVGETACFQSPTAMTAPPRQAVAVDHAVERHVLGIHHAHDGAGARAHEDLGYKPQILARA